MYRPSSKTRREERLAGQLPVGVGPRRLAVRAGALVVGMLMLVSLACCHENSAAQGKAQTNAAAAEMHATPVGSSPTTAAGFSSAAIMTNPLHAPVWTNARFARLIPASGHRHGAGPTEAACLFGRTKLYVAFVCRGSHIFTRPAVQGSALWRQDCAEVWIDTSKKQNGTNFLEVIATPNGRTYACWHRTAAPPHPLRNGHPNFAHPFSRIAWKMPGLVAVGGTGRWDGRRAWTVVVAIPLNQLPRPLRTQPYSGARWRINLLRYSWVPKHAKQTRRTLFQSNLFPVERACQEFEPYKMGRLVLGPHAPHAPGAVALAR